MNKLLILFIVIFVLGLGFVSLFSREKQTTIPVKESVVSEEKKIEGYSGKVLAGNSSPFLEFKKGDYEKALRSNKIILLDFYANWCPICRAEAPGLHRGFDSLTTDKIVGFRVNFNDSETDSDEKQLAKDFNIPYQHTKVIIKNGQEIARSVDQWDTDLQRKSRK